MKTAAVILCALALLSCQEDVKPKTYEVKYEVITSSGKWFGEYIIETGEKLCTCHETEMLKPGGWTKTFNITKTPFTLHLDATTDCACFGNAGAPDVTSNIYVNNKLVATHTSNWAPGVSSADFEIE